MSQFFVEEKDGKEIMTGEIGAYDSVTGERQKEAGFPRLYMLYTELIHPKTDLNKYYEQDKAIVMKML